MTRAPPWKRDASIPFSTSEGGEVLVPVWRPEFEAATETLDLGPWTYNVKPQLLWRGTPLVVEPLIARVLIEAGWTAAWVDSFANGRRRSQ